MGKKNKKSRRYDDDDLLGGPSPSSSSSPQEEEQRQLPDENEDAVAVDTDDAVADASTAAAAAADVKNEIIQKPVKKKRGGGRGGGDGGVGGNGGAMPNKVVNIDLPHLEETMTDILRKYDDKPEEWIYRTIEKNMHLPKHSLRQNVESQLLEEMMGRVQHTLEQELDNNNNEEEEEEDVDKKERWDRMVEEMSKKSELREGDKSKLWAEAQGLGIGREEAVAMVVDAIRKNKGGTVEVGDDADPNRDGVDLEGVDNNATNASFSVSILLTLQPFVEQSSPSSQSSLAKPFSILLKYTCILLYTLLSLLLGQQAKEDATQIFEQIYLPAIKAAQLKAQLDLDRKAAEEQLEKEKEEKEEDERMIQQNTHLWSNERRCWIEKDETYHSLLHPASSSSSSSPADEDIPSTIRWDSKKKQWERWSKNLKTRTKAMKQAEAAGETLPAFTKGAFVPVRAGEGWITSPKQPEVEKDQIAMSNIRFFVCLPTTVVVGAEEEEQHLDVVDVTDWASQTVLPTKAARELEAVDSGRELFSLDVSSLLLLGKKGGKKGKGGKKKKQRKGETVEDDEEFSVAIKGVGCTAKVSDRYLNRMEI